MYIWKYSIPKIINEFEIEMPRDARVLCVQIQKGTPCIWVKTSGRGEMEKRKFVIIGTGDSFDAEGLAYRGTWQEGGGMVVWHLFEFV